MLSIENKFCCISQQNWFLVSNIASCKQYLKKIYISRSKCSIKIDWNSFVSTSFIWFSIAHLSQHRSFVSTSFICLNKFICLLIDLFQHHSFVSILFICLDIIHLSQHYSFVSARIFACSQTSTKFLAYLSTFAKSLVYLSVSV